MKPDFATIGSFFVQMMIVYGVGLIGWTIKVALSPVETWLWYRSNAVRILLTISLFFLISAGLVVVPNFAEILGALGYNADRSPAGIAIAVVLLFLAGSRIGDDHSGHDTLKVDATIKPAEVVVDDEYDDREI